jgi:hypothetical protein
MPGARENVKWGVYGIIVRCHDSHGLCYKVQHDDGSVAPYNPEELEEVMKVVRVVRRSMKYNRHINNIGEIARVDAEGDDCYQICTTNGGCGAVDKDAVVEIDFEGLSAADKYALKNNIGSV